MTNPPPPSEAEAMAIGEGFLARTLPSSNFHHREHLIMTAYLLTTFPERDWSQELPELIRRYNVSQGGTNSDTEGYHHTITMFYLNLVYRVLATVPRGDLADACAKVLASPASSTDLILRYYTRDALFSPQARRWWVDPDILAIDLDILLAEMNTARHQAPVAQSE